MHKLVKITVNEDFERVEDPQWCLVDYVTSDNATLCGGEFFGPGQSNCEYEAKTVQRGGTLQRISRNDLTNTRTSKRKGAADPCIHRMRHLRR